MMLDMRERYNVIPSVLVTSEGELSERCRENGIEAFCTKFYNWQSSGGLKARIKGIMKQAVNRVLYHRRILSLLHGRKFDIIHTNASVTETGSLIARKLHVPHVWHIREYGLEDYNLHYMQPMSIVRAHYARAAKVVAISQSIYKSYVSQKKILSAKNTVCIPNGLKVPGEYPKTYTHNGRVNFCMTGLVYPGKNILMALRACNELKALTDKFTLHIIGNDTGEYSDMLKDYVHTHGLEGHVKFWGFRRDVWDVLRDMDVGLMLSKREAFGRVTVEYMMSYMPVIGVDTGGTPEIVADGKTGFIVPLDDASRLSEVMHRFIMNPGLLEEMGRKGRERAVNNFSLERNTDAVYSLYQEVLALQPIR